jgi:hypothetical protein
MYQVNDFSRTKAAFGEFGPLGCKIRGILSYSSGGTVIKRSLSLKFTLTPHPTSTSEQ